MGGSGKVTNLEQLFSAGYAGCYLGAMRFAAGKAKIDMPAVATVSSNASIGARDDGEGFGLEVTLNVNLPGMTKTAAEHWPQRATLCAPTRIRSRAMSKSRRTFRSNPSPTQSLIPARTAGIFFFQAESRPVLYKRRHAAI